MRNLSKYKIVFFIFLFGIIFSANSYNDPVFKDIKYIYGSENKKTCRAFLKNYKKNVFSQKEKSLIVFLISDFDQRNLNSYDAYLDFFSFSNTFAKNESDFLNNWLRSLANCISDLSDSDLERILWISNNFIQNSILSESEKFTWSFVGGQDFFLRDTLLFELNLESLILSNQFHEIVINNVNGFFDLRKNKFFATSGFVDGERFGFNPIKIKVNLGEFELDLSTSSIEVANAVLQNNVYFNVESKGHFSDYLSRVPRQGDFPKFQSYADDLKINFFNGFSCVGAVDIKKNIFFLKRFNKPLNFFISNEYVKGVFYSDVLKIKDSSFSSNNVNTSFFFNNGDSIFHPNMKFRYDDLEKNIYLRKYDFSYLSYKPILNSFHGLNIYSDFLRVNLKNSTAAFVHYPSKVEQKVLFESVDYYDDQRFLDLDIDEKNNLLAILIKFSNDLDLKNSIPIDTFSEELNLNNSQVISILKTLEIFDFVSVDSYLSEFDIKKKAFTFYESRQRKYDFDSFQIESSCFLNDTVSQINFKNYKMDIFNVLGVKITNQHEYDIDLKNKNISFFDDRSFNMNANLRFGNFLFSSKNIEFNYDEFCFYFPDESSCNIFDLKSSKKNKFIQKISFKGGRVQIDSVNNKSGSVAIYDFPRFYLPKDNFISFPNQDPILVLNEKVIPFLDEIAIQNLSFDGFLNMTNRFKFLKGDVLFDFSNGFSFTGKFKNNMLYEQFICSGDLMLNKNMFLIKSADIYNDNFSFSSDSLFINSKFSYSNSVSFKELKSGLKSPSCSFNYNYSDSVMLFSSGEDDFSFYDFNFSGILNYDFSENSNNIFGKGKLLSPFFNIESDYFSFSDNSFMSGNSSVSVIQDGFNKFLAKGVSVEWSKSNNSLSMIKGDVNFFLPKIQLYLNFDLATLNSSEKLISFSNVIDGKQTNLLLKNYFEFSVTSFLYDFQSSESQIFYSKPFYSNKHFIDPVEQFLVLNNFGFLNPFVAKTIMKKKLGQNEILKNKLVSFDKDMRTFLIQ